MTGAAPSGVLRAALNLNNAALVHKAGDSYTGLAPDLARRIADATGRQLRFVDYSNARAIVEDTAQAWDIAFLAIDPSRLDRLAFSKPYHRVEATFLVRADQLASSCSEVLAGEDRIISAKGAAYHSPLAVEVGGDRLIVAESPAEAAELFRQGHGDALAGIRETLGKAGQANRVLPDVFARIEQAVAVPIGASDLMRQIELCMQDFNACNRRMA
ncbi:transporter substrate-binding domain-containing protein [Paracoccus tibetensis]|uniref:Polar amino acid transport system substrate-binding protein n=1 Tax=Paracoccus tibetensis TaxID=336292 RepID=A0A1G5I4J1_9RHOB|nr:transporter substrate-binding domain-containing protein [Paracoccus tibetensis]SCY70976.1 polar amino acid transport system substrate-binding protein [Paracoccus tibetensis]